MTANVELRDMRYLNRPLLVFPMLVVLGLIPLLGSYSLSLSFEPRAVVWQDAQQIVQTEPGMFYYVWYLRPKVAAANGQAFVVWQDFNLSSLDKMVFFSSFDGTEWQSPIPLDLNTSCTPNPDIAAEKGHIYVVWASREQPNGDININYGYYDDTMWLPVIDVGMGGNFPKIVAEQNHLHLIWRAGGLYYRHFDGTTWQPPVQIGFTNQSSEFIGPPALTVVEGTIHVVWAQEKPTYGIYYQQFNGLSWQPPELISSFGRNPSVSAGKDSVHVVWEVAKGAQREFDIYYRRFHGSAWESPLGLSPKGSETFEEKHLPAIVERQGRLYVVWFDFFLTAEGKHNVYGGAIMFCHYDGTTWFPEEILQEEIRQEAGYPTLAVDSTSLHLVWVNRDVTGEVSGIFYREGIIQVESISETSEFVSVSEGILCFTVLVPLILHLIKRRKKKPP
ncbi:MAG: hypothetical protein ACE5R6_21610 [Candidatus Heimdallarchaeota archaeon]